MTARLAVVLLLVAGAFFAAGPWLSCAAVPMFVARRVIPDVAATCTFGQFASSGYGLPGFAGPYWGDLLVGLVYLIAAIWLALWRRTL